MAPNKTIDRVLESSELLLSHPTVSVPILHRTTTLRRAKGQIQSRQEYREQCGLLSKVQEQRLLQHIDELTRRGLPPNHHNVRIFAQNICGKLPGKNWPSQFVRRHAASITSQYLVGFDICRKKADNWWLINHYFELVQEKWKQYNYAPENVYNMDEKGFMIGMLQKTKRIFTKSWLEQGKLQGAAQDGNRTWITLVAGICMDGTSLPPALIYPAESGDIQDSWLDDYQEDEECYFTSSPSGWTNDELAMEWLTKVFDRATKAKARFGRDPRLLFLDGHGSHINLKFLDWCDKHNIQICAYPPHTTHRLQPLDVSLFAPLATYYTQELDRWISVTQALCKMNKRHFYKLFKVAFEKAFSEHNIRSGWEQTGLLPLEPSRILNQLSTKHQAQSSRPTSKDSGTGSSISLSDWKKINEVVRSAVGDVLNYEARQVVKHCHQLQAENALLKAQISGLQEAVRIKEKQKKPSKPLFKELRANEGNTAMFFSPKKISAARQLAIEKQGEIKAAKAQKLHDKLQKEIHKKEQMERKEQAAQIRLEKRQKLAEESAQKLAAKNEALQERLANLQLSNEQNSTKKNRFQKPKVSQKQSLLSSDSIEPVDNVVALLSSTQTSKSGRQLRKPPHLNNYEL